MMADTSLSAMQLFVDGPDLVQRAQRELVGDQRARLARLSHEVLRLARVRRAESTEVPAVRVGTGGDTFAAARGCLMVSR